jgi:hypothetical protein
VLTNRIRFCRQRDRPELSCLGQGCTPSQDVDHYVLGLHGNQQTALDAFELGLALLMNYFPASSLGNFSNEGAFLTGFERS